MLEKIERISKVGGARKIYGGAIRRKYGLILGLSESVFCRLRITNKQNWTLERLRVSFVIHYLKNMS